MIQKLLVTLLFFNASVIIQAQQVSSKILDEETKEPIPYASIQFSKTDGVMSNEEGMFEFPKPKNITSKDSLKITSLGYRAESFSLQDTIPEIIFLKQEVFEIDPVILSNKKLSVDEIIDNVKNNLDNNYQTKYIAGKAFIRETYKQRIKKFNFDVEKSSIDNINQTLFDTIVGKFPKNFTSLVESYGDVYSYNNKKSKTNLQKVLLIQSKHEISSIKKIQEDFFKTLRDNTKPNSYLVIKSGIIRLDKTETIDSILGEEEKRKAKPIQTKNKDIQKYRDILVNRLFENLFINEEASVDILNKSNKYEFHKTGFIEIGDDLAYIIEFNSKGKAKYKGKLFINTEDFAVIRADIQGAHKIFDKHFNMLGISANDLSYNSTIIFTKNKDNKYSLKYLKISDSQQVGIDRPIKIIEKNKFVKGRRKQNQISFQMNIQIINYSTKEIVFTDSEFLPKSMFEAFKPKSDFQIKRLDSYDSSFWNGYKIITPEKAIKELKIE